MDTSNGLFWTFSVTHGIWRAEPLPLSETDSLILVPWLKNKDTYSYNSLDKKTMGMWISWNDNISIITERLRKMYCFNIAIRAVRSNCNQSGILLLAFWISMAYYYKLHITYCLCILPFTFHTMPFCIIKRATYRIAVKIPTAHVSINALQELPGLEVWGLFYFNVDVCRWTQWTQW